MTVQWHDIVGAVGVGSIIITYVLLQTNRVRSEQLAYSGVNAAGATMIIVSLYFDFNFSAFVVEFFWLLISLFGIAKYFRLRRGRN
ncbi:MAG: hypothetical protein K1X36_00105 [Pyrinomonadaceae bacterium]|nr:hypothetical protein [Pyrinomonadaceae bacterium]